MIGSVDRLLKRKIKYILELVPQVYEKKEGDGMMKRRLISCLMVLALMCSFLPASVLADEVQEEPTVPVIEEVQPAAEEQEETPEEHTDPEVSEKSEEQPQEIETPQEEPETVFAPAAQEGEGETPAVGETAHEGTVAKIETEGEETQYFKTLRAAVAAAQTGDTITLLTDCEGTVQISMNSKKDTPTALTIDLNEHAIDGKGEKRCILGIQADSRTDQCALTVKNGTLRNGAASGSSGGAISWPCDLKIENCTIENNADKAVDVFSVTENCLVEVSDTKFIGNHETKDSGSGGAVSIKGNGTAKFTRCTFTNNSATNMGGALYCDHGELTLTDCTFENNSAAFGGAVAGMEITIIVDGKKTSMSDNTAASTGGAIHLQTNSKLNIKAGVLEANKAAYGGAVYLYMAKGTIGGTLQNNSAGSGGAVYNWKSETSVSGRVKNNNAALGGGCYNSDAVLDLTGADIYNNTATTAGDDIFSLGASSKLTVNKTGKWTLDDCKDRIDGWYEDGMPETVVNDDEKTSTVYGPRWDAHSAEGYVKAWAAGTAEGPLAIKAAHKVIVPIDPGEPDAPFHSKSKTATNLDRNYRSDVTLSLPAQEETLASDVVFVLDKSTSAALEEQALAMLKNLQEQIRLVGGKVKVGVVIFNKEAHATGLMDLETQYADIEAAVKQELNSGTNTHAGLLAGKALLDEDTDVDASRKYLIFVSDGITYMYGAEPTVTAWTWNTDGHTKLAWVGPDNWGTKNGAKYVPADWDAYLDQAAAQITRQGETYEHPYTSGDYLERGEAATPCGDYPAEDYKNYANSTDKALYLTREVYRDARSAGYHCYAVPADTDKASTYPFGPSFMAYLAGGEEVSFGDIGNDILYLLGAGSRVEDTIGYTDDYNFDLVRTEGQCPFTLTVTGADGTKTVYTARADGENTWTFRQDDADGDARFTVTYHPGEKGDERFTWTFNQSVTNFQRVELTYTVQLMNPKTASGTYGQFDADGSEKYKGLWTNNSATLYPMDSDGAKGLPENFAKPTVSYTVGGSSGGGGDSGKLNTEDHYSYIIGYKDGYLRPYGNISRGETATIFFRMLTDKTRTEYWSQTNPYTDVAAEKWCSNAISTLHRMGIIDGYADGTFRPDGPITRAAFTKMAVNFFDYHVKAYDGKFSDVDGDAWYAGYIQAASELKLIEGFDDGTFRPNDYITRAQACTIINRTLGRVPHGDHMNIKPLVTWPDCDADDWYYAAMMEATNSHDYKWITVSKEKTEEWTAKLPQRDWAALEHTWSTANSAKGGEVVG